MQARWSPSGVHTARSAGQNVCEGSTRRNTWSAVAVGSLRQIHPRTSAQTRAVVDVIPLVLGVAVATLTVQPTATTKEVPEPSMKNSCGHPTARRCRSRTFVGQLYRNHLWV